MNAKEANELCIISCYDEIQETLIEIEEAAKNKQNSIVKFIQGGTINRLKQLGFYIETESYIAYGQIVVQKITISW